MTAVNELTGTSVQDQLISAGYEGIIFSVVGRSGQVEMWSQGGPSTVVWSKSQDDLRSAQKTIIIIGANLHTHP